MSVTESQVPVGNTGEQLETIKYTRGSGDVVHREGVMIGSGDSTTLAHVNSSNELLVKSNATSGLIFSTTALLGNAETYDSGILSLVGYTQVATSILSAGVGGTILITWYQDAAGADLLRTISIPYVADTGFKYFSAPAFTPYVRYRFTTSGAGQTDFYFDTKVTQAALSPQILGMTDFITDGMVSNLSRSIMTGKTAGGVYANVGITNQRAMQTTPPEEGKTAFGEGLTARLVDQQLVNFTFGNIDQLVVSRTNGSGAVVANSNQLATVSTSAAANRMAELKSMDVIRYVPGHGNRARMTAMFTTGVADSIQLAGIGDVSNGFFFGYNGTSFGILHRKNGHPEIRTLTISAGANDGTGTDNITITLDGNATTVTLTDFTGNATITANEIAAADYSNNGTGWTAKAFGSTVVFESYDAAAHTGTFTLVDTDSTGAAGTFAQTVAGAAPSNSWTAQASWNGDEIFNGSGITGQTLDPTKLNVYQIVYQYLGAGAIFFFIEDKNDGELHLVHTVRYANANTTTSLSNPHLPLMIHAENAANTSNLTISSGSWSGMTDGDVQLSGPRRGLSANSGAISSTTPVLVVKNVPVFLGKKNTNKIKILNLSVSAVVASGNSSVTVTLIKNPTITNASYTAIDASNSIIEYDTAATAYTGGVVLATQQVLAGTTTSFDTDDPNDLVFEGGDTLLINATPTGANTTVYVSARFVELF